MPEKSVRPEEGEMNFFYYFTYLQEFFLKEAFQKSRINKDGGRNSGKLIEALIDRINEFT